jgi:hypothetical protein
MRNLNHKAARYVMLIGLGFMNIFMFQNCSNWQGQVMVTDTVGAMNAEEDGQMIPDIDLGPKVSDSFTAAEMPSAPPANLANSNQDLDTALANIGEASGGANGGANGQASSDDLGHQDEGQVEDSNHSDNQVNHESQGESSNQTIQQSSVSESNSDHQASFSGGNQQALSDSSSVGEKQAENSVSSDNQVDSGTGNAGNESLNTSNQSSGVTDNPEDATIPEFSDDNPEFACTKEFLKFKRRAKVVHGVLEENSSEKGRGVWEANYDLASVKTKGKHIIINNAGRALTIDSVESKGSLVLCGNFNVKKIASLGHIVYVNANVEEGKVSGKIRAFSASYNNEKDSWNVIKTDEYSGQAESYSVFAGKITINSSSSLAEHLQKPQELHVEHRGTHQDKEEREVASTSKKEEESREESKPVIPMQEEKKHVEHNAKPKEPKQEEPKHEEPKHEENQASTSSSDELKASANSDSESVAEKLVKTTVDVVGKCTDAVGSLVGESDSKKHGSNTHTQSGTQLPVQGNTQVSVTARVSGRAGGR